MEERLQKFMARSGVGSRRYCEELIKSGRVKVNGKVVTELGTKVDPAKDKVEVDDKAIHPKEERLYIMINKPSGFITSVTDKFGRPTVIDLLGGISDRVYPVGRLDIDTEGLLILTNDGELAFRLTHPRYKVRKTYVAEVIGHPTDENLDRLRKGIMLEDGMTAPAEVKILRQVKNATFVEITIHEGRKRQIKRMFQAIGHRVVFLKRISIDNVLLDNLPLGDFRHLTEKEIDNLYRAVRLR
ncbi:MAG: rRNA pseudouridine synthase [Firmicutes bacterium]|nr:rRNA pseudouridine synthase [Bacillota bacterium]